MGYIKENKLNTLRCLSLDDAVGECTTRKSAKMLHYSQFNLT